MCIIIILAEETFTTMEEKNVISWNPMGYAKAGDLTAPRAHDYVRQHNIKMDNYVGIFTANVDRLILP